MWTIDGTSFISDAGTSLHWAVSDPPEQILLKIDLPNMSTPLFWAVGTYFWSLGKKILSNVGTVC